MRKSGGNPIRIALSHFKIDGFAIH